VSIKVTSWVLNHAPVDNPALVLTLLAMAERANDDGTDARQSVKTIASKARVSVRTAQRYLRSLEDMGLISRGDQRSVQHLRPDRRPMVYDINIDQSRGDNLTPRGADGVTDGAQRGDRPGTNGVTPVADKSSLLLPTEEEPVLDSKSVAPTSGRGTRLPEGWEPSPSLAVQMRDECPGVDLRQAHLAFTDHFRAIPGQKGVMLDWSAAWRNWIRREAKFHKPGTARPRPSTTDAGIAAIQAMKHPHRLEIA